MYKWFKIDRWLYYAQEFSRLAWFRYFSKWRPILRYHRFWSRLVITDSYVKIKSFCFTASLENQSNEWAPNHFDFFHGRNLGLSRGGFKKIENIVAFFYFDQVDLRSSPDSLFWPVPPFFTLKNFTPYNFTPYFLLP